MKENKYDEELFFEKYSHFPRSVEGLQAAGEWHELQKMLPDFKGKRVLDLGCGFGWHCIYAAEQGAISIVGVDISKKMLAEADKKTKYKNISYICNSIEDYEYPEQAFDVVISSLSFHYVERFDDICIKVNRCLADDGDFVFSVEHPVFTAQGKQDWVYDKEYNPMYWPVDHYFLEGSRCANFLGENVIKYHKTFATYAGALLKYGFLITGICEPTPTQDMLKKNPLMNDELRRPMMLILSAKKRYAV